MKKIIAISIVASAALLNQPAMSASRVATQIAEVTAKQMPAIKSIAAQSNVIDAIKTSNRVTTELRGKALRGLDEQWRQQIAQGGGQLIDQTQKDNALAQALHHDIQQSHGVYRGALVMNNKGINVAQTMLTKHYFQKGRSVWRKPYKLGQDYVSQATRDKSTGKRYIMMAVPVNNAQQKRIGVFAMQVNLKT